MSSRNEISTIHMDDYSVPTPKLPAGPASDVSPAPPPPFNRENDWTQDNTSISAVSFGFVATAILISMFLVMAIFEKFLRPRSSVPPILPLNGTESHNSETSPVQIPTKMDETIPESSCCRGVPVLMPGHEIPTFIANPVPIPCPPEGISWPCHEQALAGSCSFDPTPAAACNSFCENSRK